ncbi:50S ribosomal protein L23 [Patescibacteria group bacterium]|nr:50S ribosomal protein L23 [Patescibacteria group bacterium]
MAILDVFKKRRKVKGKKIVKEKKPKEKLIERTPTPRPESQKRAPKPKIGEAYRILKAPQVTEKATGLVAKNQYVFKVFPKANKVEIKKAIENLYRVNVISVKIIKIPKKPRRLGRISGWRKGYKKAIVGIKKGQKIEILSR